MVTLVLQDLRDQTLILEQLDHLREAQGHQAQHEALEALVARDLVERGLEVLEVVAVLEAEVPEVVEVAEEVSRYINS